MDIPSLCPDLSFAQPWSVPPGFVSDMGVRLKEEQKHLVILEVNNVSVGVTQFDLPRPKELVPNLSSKNKTRCSQRYNAAHCGPISVRYNMVRMEWVQGVADLSEKEIVLQQGNISDIYTWGEESNISLPITEIPTKRIKLG